MSKKIIIRKVKSEEAKREKLEAHARKKAGTTVYTMYELALILEGYALDEHETTIHGFAVKLRAFLSGINDIEIVGDNSDILELMLLKVANKSILIPILCGIINSEAKKFTQVFRQVEPYFVFGQQDTVNALYNYSKSFYVDTDKYKQVSKLINDIKKL
jgi:hypothetical protein